jgi:hypothetical protein
LTDRAWSPAALEEATSGRGMAACRCEDLSHPAPDIDPVATTITVATTRRIRLLYDIEAAALATATALLGCPHPDVLAPPTTRAADCSWPATEPA